jgi:uroporphyrinogen decarboxylase
MTSKERVQAAMRFKKPDRVPVQYYYCPVGYYEHGEKLNDLYAELEGDFSPYKKMEIPVLPFSDFDEEGKYHAFKRDDWGTFWEYRIFGVWGIPLEYPLADAERIKSYKTPAPPPPPDRKIFTQDSFYHFGGCGNLYQKIIMLRPEADVLMDIISDEPHINELADKVVEYNLALVKNAVAAGADGLAFGDDYGTERGLMMSHELWRKFFFPRLDTLFRPARESGLDIHFHSCGNVWDLLPDFAELGVTSVWPQIPVYSMPDLARRCRELGLAIAVHTDRARTMTFGKPEDVRALVQREYETFRLYDGGGWFYIEADNGFPFANIEALVRAIKETI